MMKFPMRSVDVACLWLVEKSFLRERSSDLERLNNCCSQAVWLILAQSQGNCKEVV